VNEKSKTTRGDADETDLKLFFDEVVFLSFVHVLVFHGLYRKNLSINKKCKHDVLWDVDRIHDVLFLCHHYHFCFHMLTFIRVLQYPSFHL